MPLLHHTRHKQPERYPSCADVAGCGPPNTPAAPAASACASAVPPSGPTLLLAILKSSIAPPTARSSDAMWVAPSSPDMLLNKCSPLRLTPSPAPLLTAAAAAAPLLLALPLPPPLLVKSSKSAAQACTEQPTFWRDRNS